MLCKSLSCSCSFKLSSPICWWPWHWRNYAVWWKTVDLPLPDRCVWRPWARRRWMTLAWPRARKGSCRLRWQSCWTTVTSVERLTRRKRMRWPCSGTNSSWRMRPMMPKRSSLDSASDWADPKQCLCLVDWKCSTRRMWHWCHCCYYWLDCLRQWLLFRGDRLLSNQAMLWDSAARCCLCAHLI